MCILERFAETRFQSSITASSLVRESILFPGGGCLQVKVSDLLRGGGEAVEAASIPSKALPDVRQARRGTGGAANLCALFPSSTANQGCAVSTSGLTQAGGRWP